MKVDTLKTTTHKKLITNKLLRGLIEGEKTADTEPKVQKMA